MAEQLTFHKKQRGVTRASLTRLATKVTELEGSTDNPDTLRIAQGLATKLKSLDAEFKTHHLSIVDLTDEEQALVEEQEGLDNHDDLTSELNVRIQRLVSSSTPSTFPDLQRSSLRRFTRLREKLASIGASIDALTDDDVCTLQQYEEQIIDLKKELKEAQATLLDVDLETGDPLIEVQDAVEKAIFECSLAIKKQLRATVVVGASATPEVRTPGAKLPKLEVPTFNGDVLNWKGFWEQFCVSVHDRADLMNAEKLVYLQNSIKDSTAKRTIEGLTKSGEHYEEAVRCLKSRYDRPRLIHQTHVRRILDAPTPKEGSGKELRILHDVVLQHLRALKAMGHEPSNSFVTSMLELKLDTNTMFEWQRHTQEHTDVPDCHELLEFINLRAQAAEASYAERKPLKGGFHPHGPRVNKPVPSFVSNTLPVDTHCIACKGEKHPLYSCSKFRSLSHPDKLALVKSNDHCLNCLRPGHFVKECKSLHHCKHCQKPHHTLLHVESKPDAPAGSPSLPLSSTPLATAHHASVKLRPDTLLMTCQVVVETPRGSVKARALLDSASTASFVSERLAQLLRLQRHPQDTSIRGIAGLAHDSHTQSLTSFRVSSVHSPTRKFNVKAIIIPQVTCSLPVHPITFNGSWKHLDGLPLADPEFNKPGRVDVLLGVETFVEVVRQGRRKGAHNSPTAIETEFGWVLAGSAGADSSSTVVSHHVSVLTGDDLLRRFWEVEEKPMAYSTLTPEERAVLNHFQAKHARTTEGRFVVPLPKRPAASKLGESRSQAVRRFTSFEKSLRARGQFKEFEKVINEYFRDHHAERVPLADLERDPSQVFYLPMHLVCKESSTTTKLRAVFDASAKTSNGISLNDTLLVGPTVNPSLVDVLLRFRSHRVALVADVSRMYRAILLSESDKDLHRFVWRSDPKVPLGDFRMTRITFGVSSSSFIANMCLKQNAIDFATEYPKAAEVVEKSFYVDDCLTGSDSIQGAVDLQHELQELFNHGGFLLRKWNSNEPSVLQHIDPELRDAQSTLSLSNPDEYTKTLGIEWNSASDQFRLTVADLPVITTMTKRALVSDVAKTFDALGWYSPTIVKAKILLQRLWSEKVDWDDLVPDAILHEWSRWRGELYLLSRHHIPRCYHPRQVVASSVQLHGFSDASEQAYSGVVYIRVRDMDAVVHTSVVMSKTRVAPIKRQTIPRLELCGALVLAQLLSHCKTVLDIPMDQVFAWTDSTIVLNWIQGNPRRFKVYVGNRVSQVLDLLPPDRWNHVVSADNPADCASRGLYPSEILTHDLWWNGPDWLKYDQSRWPMQSDIKLNSSEEASELCAFTCAAIMEREPLLPLDKFSTFTLLKRVTAWVLRFVRNCRARKLKTQCNHDLLSVDELNQATSYWIKFMQGTLWHREIQCLKKGTKIPRSSPLLSLNPTLDDSGVLRVGGRQQNAKSSHDFRHPIILSSKHLLVKLLIRSEHLRLLHGGPLLLSASLSRQFHIVGGHRAIRSITRSCVICRRRSARPRPQMMGQLPVERITPDAVFSRVGLDYAGPIYLKQGSTRKPVMVKAYVCVFVSLSVKAVHLEAVSDLTSEAFLACLRRFMARRGKPHLIWSDHGTNFVGAKRLIKELFDFLQQRATNKAVSKFCSSQGITWDFIPERAPHFGGLWESAVKILKTHLQRIVGNAKLTYEELSTILAQIEACMNSRPLGVIPHNNDDGIEVLTPGHFLVGRPIEAIPDHPSSYRPISLLRRWYLCEALVRHFWERWHSEYITSLRRYTKWHLPTKNLEVGDIVVLREDNAMPTRWPLARIVETHMGKDNLVRVVKLKTQDGIYTRPANKVALLLPCELS